MTPKIKRPLGTTSPGQVRLSVPFFFFSDVVKLLLEYGAFVNQTDKAHFKTGLHVACEAQSVACVQYLLDAGADPNVQAEHGRTPLHIGM